MTRDTFQGLFIFGLIAFSALAAIVTKVALARAGYSDDDAKGWGRAAGLLAIVLPIVLLLILNKLLIRRDIKRGKRDE